MRILQVINTLSLGGAENLLVQLISKLKQHGQECDLLVLNLSEDDILYKEVSKMGIQVYSLNCSSIYNPINILYHKAIFVKYDLVHVHLFPSQYWSALASLFISKSLRPILITTEHSTSNRRRSIPILKYIDRYIYSKYKSIICISNSTFLSLRSYLDLDIPAQVIENGIDLDKFITAIPLDKKQFGFKESDIIITMVAGFRLEKDQDTLIRSMLYLPINYKLLLVGVGERMDVCQKLSNKLNLADRVVFSGLRSDIENIFAMSKLGVVSSNWEGFGLVAAECMATGRPVIASDVEGLRDVVGDQRLLFPRGDEKALASRILEVVSSESYYSELSQKCLSQSKCFSIETMVEKTLALYNKLIDEKNN